MEKAEHAIAEREKRPAAFHVAANIALAAVCGLGFGFTVYVFLLSMFSGSVNGARDFVSFWATGRLLVQHADPYNGAALLQIERAAGFPAHYSVMFMRNPPWNLPLVYPLGLFGLQTASILWSIVQVGLFVLSVHLLWTMQGRPQNRRHYLGYAFAPALICLIMGQLTMFALLGLVLFLRLHSSRPFWAGAALWFCMLKPHLLLPFGVVLLVWVFATRTYRLIAGALCSVAVSSAVAQLLVPINWSEYSRVLGKPAPEWEFVPCLSILLRVLIDKDAAWLGYIPAALGCAWALWYFWSRKSQWDWQRDGSIVLLVSILVTPHTYLYDQALAIPALLYGAYATRSRNLLIVLATLSVLIELALLGIVWRPTTLYTWTLWSAPAWIVWYLLATGKTRAEAEETSGEALAAVR